MANENEMEDFVVMTDEDGNEVQFEFLDIVEYEGGEYAVMLPVEDEDGLVLITKIVPDEEDSEMECYIPVEDDALLDKIYDLFKERNQEEFNFED